MITNVKVATDVMKYADKDLNGKPLAAGTYFRVEYPTNGFWSTVIRTVRDASGNIIHQDTVFSKYVRVTGLTLIGWAPGDPQGRHESSPTRTRSRTSPRADSGGAQLS